MAQFDQVFAELQAKMAAAIQVISQDPVMAQQVREAIDNAQTEAEIAEQKAQDDARANALRSVIVDVRGALAQAVGAAPAEPPTGE